MVFARILAVPLLIGALLVHHPAMAQEDQPLSPKQTDAVRKIIRDYLMEHPEVVQEAVEALREKMRQQAEADARKNIETYKTELFDNKDDPFIGNPKGDVTIVEFFDYNCPFCKAVSDSVWDTIKADGKVKLVFKEFPILTDDSVTASRMALAAKKQGKYDEIHHAFMKYKGKMDEKAALKVAADAGVNIDQMKKDMTAPEIDRLIRRNKEIAHALDIDGTPSFIIGDRIIPQAIEAQTLKQLIEVARKTKPTAPQPG